MHLRYLTLATLFALGFLAGCGTTSTGTPTTLSGEVRLAAVFTDHMVLQRDQKIPVWGWAPPGVRVAVSMNGEHATAKADRDGAWMAHLNPMPAGGPYTLTVSENTVRFEDVLVGDVWLASGQSNMWWPVKSGAYGVANRDEEVAAANYPNIRLFTVPQATNFTPQVNFDSAGWMACAPESVKTFSAVAYFFGREMHQTQGVPIGLIHSSWGGTLCEAWTSADALRKLPDFKAKLDTMAAQAPRMAEAGAAYEKAMDQWYAPELAAYDKGHVDGVPVWADRGLDTQDWRSMQLPCVWEDQGYADLDGFMWYRKVLELPDQWAGQDLTLSLGPINDMDRTYFNGKLVGSNEGLGQAPAFRNYSVPGDAVVPHVNVVAVRVYDLGNVGGINGNEEDMYVTLAAEADGLRIPLAGVWQNKPGAYLRDVPPQPEAPLLRDGDPNVPTVLYNAMIAPLVPYALKGAIWYQGESNAQRAYQYRDLFPAMIEDWRGQWDQGDFPFLYVQLANFLKVEEMPGESAWAELREAQDRTLALKNTGMATIIDIGEAEDIHPQNKQDVGKRLGLAARHVAYGENVVYSGPRLSKFAVEGATARVHFDHLGGGLTTPDGAPVKGFAIAGADRKFVWAEGRIEGDTVVLSNGAVGAPVAVRYAWANNPVCNLYNKAGLPAAPFRTDSWPGVTAANK